MAGLEEALHGLLASDATVAALVAARIHPVAAPQDVPRPFITFRTTAQLPFAPITGPPSLARSRVIIACWGEEWTDARGVADAVLARLDGYDGTDVIQSARLVTKAEGLDPDSGYFGRQLDFSIIHRI